MTDRPSPIKDSDPMTGPSPFKDSDPMIGAQIKDRPYDRSSDQGL
jgi:hypothetical protein